MTLQFDDVIVKTIYRGLRPLMHIPENSMERLSVRESISKRWTTLKQRLLEGLQTVGSLRKYNDDKGDSEQQKV